MKLHKQHLVKFGLTAISALILTACGSSGGGGGSSAPSSENTMPTNQVQQPAQPQAEQTVEQKTEVKPETPTSPNVAVKPEQPVQPKAEVKPDNPTSPNVEVKPEQPVQPKTEEKPEHPKLDNSTGAFISIKEKVGNKDDLDIHIVPINQFNVNKINIDGIEVDVNSEEYLGNLWANFSDSKSNRDIIICCEKYTDMRFGALDSPDDKLATYFFYNGNPTQIMPTGIASYQGNAIFTGDFDSSFAYNNDGYPIGTAKFDVNFTDKILKGTLTPDSGKNVSIQADIVNNSFNGSATSDAFKADTKVKVEGKFFGENAKELGGIAESFDNTFSAAFGAEKTSK